MSGFPWNLRFHSYSFPENVFPNWILYNSVSPSQEKQEGAVKGSWLRVESDHVLGCSHVHLKPQEELETLTKLQNFTEAWCWVSRAICVCAHACILKLLQTLLLLFHFLAATPIQTSRSMGSEMQPCIPVVQVDNFFKKNNKIKGGIGQSRKCQSRVIRKNKTIWTHVLSNPCKVD